MPEGDPQGHGGPTDDLIQPFRIGRFGLRGRIVRLGEVADTILSRHDYPAPIAQLLGESLALTAALAGALKYDGVFTLQTKGDGPVPLLVTDATSDGALRGYAQIAHERADELPPEPPEHPVPHLLGSGHLAFTVDQGPHTDRYQGVVALEGGTLSECAHHYFQQSEQLETGIVLAAGRVGGNGGGSQWRASALMIQYLPEEGGHDADAVEDGWRSAMALMSTVRRDELLDPAITPRELLYKLFHEEGVRAYRVKPLDARCRCSRERIERVLAAMPPEDLDDMKIDGEVVVTCQFCSAEHRFDDAALAEIFRRRAQ